MIRLYKIEIIKAYKSLIIGLGIFIFLASTDSALAFSEIQCRGNGIDLRLDAWGSNTNNVRADLRVRENGRTNRTQFTMFERNSRSFLTRYIGGNNRLEINTWPDEEMQNLRQYRAIFESRSLGLTRITCTYWD